MNPQDLRIVQQSWAQLRLRRAPLLDELAIRFETTDRSVMTAEERATWLVEAVEQLVGLLPAPRRLASQARLLGETWPDPCSAPSFAVEGRAWLAAADVCLPTWTERTAIAWRQAWLLLSDVLASAALSPFADDPTASATPTASPNPPDELPDQLPDQQGTL
jgi:hypothetical protein